MTKSSLQQIIQTLNDANANYLVVGGLAVIAHGHLRFTSDVNLLIKLEEANILAALRALQALGYAPTSKAPFAASKISSR
jgi:predicted nucleotidyltransferase